MAARPVSVITGYLGSGKTTLLNELLRQPAMVDALALLQSPRYRSVVAALAGYEAAETGRVMAVDEGLPDA